MVEHISKTRQHWLFYVSEGSEYAGFKYQRPCENRHDAGSEKWLDGVL